MADLGPRRLRECDRTPRTSVNEKPGRPYGPEGEGTEDRPGSRSRRGSARVGAQTIGALTLTELAHHLTLDLPHAFAGQTEQLADLVEGARLAVVEAVAQADHLLLPLVEGGQDATDVDCAAARR